MKLMLTYNIIFAIVCSTEKLYHGDEVTVKTKDMKIMVKITLIILIVALLFVWFGFDCFFDNVISFDVFGKIIISVFLIILLGGNIIIGSEPPLELDDDGNITIDQDKNDE